MNAFKTAILAGAALAVGTLSLAAQSEAMSPEGLLAKGGQLYDWYYKISEGDVMKSTHALMPEGGKKGKGSWRCSTCHGFDYNGAFDLKGLQGAAGKSADDIVAILRDAKHGYTADILNDQEAKAVGMFVSKGVIDVAKAKGDAAKGQGYYETICAVCHGPDGKKISDMPPVGAVVNELPERSLHRIRYSKPAEDMPAMSALPLQVALDVWEYTKTLPTE